MTIPDLSMYGLEENKTTVTVFGNGLINHTWKITSSGKNYLLQKINQQVFRKPEDIMDNLRLLSEYFKENFPDYLFVAPLLTGQGTNYIREDDGYYRLFPFVDNAHSVDIITDNAMAFEASGQFGKFTSLLTDFNPDLLRITLPDFHNLTLRYRQFEDALQNGNQQRIKQTGEAIQFLRNQRSISDTFELIKTLPDFKRRVIHHDAKINNVLFDKRDNRGLCLIDLDTVMPGYYISDVGDMLRTYICPVSEDEQDFSGIQIREDYFGEIVKGYLNEMGSALSESEKNHFVFAGKYAIYMQALRFLTDYLNNDVYYHIKYNDHNLIRAKNQIVLLKKYIEKEEILHNILQSAINFPEGNGRPHSEEVF